MDRRILRIKAKAEFKKLKKESPQNKNISFTSFFAFFRARERMAALSGKVSETAATMQDNDSAFLDQMFSSGPTEDIIEVVEATV